MPMISMVRLERQYSAYRSLGILPRAGDLDIGLCLRDCITSLGQSEDRARKLVVDIAGAPRGDVSEHGVEIAETGVGSGNRAVDHKAVERVFLGNLTGFK